jgi:glycogen phosphorylase
MKQEKQKEYLALVCAWSGAGNTDLARQVIDFLNLHTRGSVILVAEFPVARELERFAESLGRPDLIPDHVVGDATGAPMEPEEFLDKATEWVTVSRDVTFRNVEHMQRIVVAAQHVQQSFICAHLLRCVGIVPEVLSTEPSSSVVFGSRVDSPVISPMRFRVFIAGAFVPRFFVLLLLSPCFPHMRRDVMSCDWYNRNERCHVFIFMSDAPRHIAINIRSRKEESSPLLEVPVVPQRAVAVTIPESTVEVNDIPVREGVPESSPSVGEKKIHPRPPRPKIISDIEKGKKGKKSRKSLPMSGVRTIAPRRVSSDVSSSFVDAPRARSSRMVPQKPPIEIAPHEGMDMASLRVAYFCMEIALSNDMPTYAGGLGILAGDMLKSAADLKVPMIGVTLLHRKGFFRQRLDASGWQFEEEAQWQPEAHMQRLPHAVTITLEGRAVYVHAWMYHVKGLSGHDVPVIFLDTDVATNAEGDRHITDKLYDSDQHWRLLQEAVLGIGGARMLAALGVTNLAKYHMNEGHAALLTLELYREASERNEADPLAYVRDHAVFTTHTPVAAGHDRFTRELVAAVLGADHIPAQLAGELFDGDALNMTRLGFYFSGHINGVAKKHGEVTRELFPGYRVEFITNGVYAREWVAEPLARLYDTYLPGWQSDPHSLRYVLSIPLPEIWDAHQTSKRALIDHVNERYHVGMDEHVFTIGFARRAASYKRATMLFFDIERLMRIAEHSKGIQVIFAGKAHPADNEGKLMIQRVIEHMRAVGHKIRCVYLEDYDMEVGKRLVAGVDLWLNTPTRPQEASGTSGMKAALNGVPQLSILDGWWLEGHIEGVTGWSIGPHPEKGVYGDNDAEDAEDMYRKLEEVILPCFERDPLEWQRVMRQSVAINGSFFNTHRMLEQYVLGAYFI